METSIQINRKDENGIIIFTFSWELDETNADKTFKSLYKSIWDFAWVNIIFNFQWLIYMNSKSIWYIADIYSKIEDNEWKMYITNCSNWVKDILDLVWITTIIPMVDTLEQAIKEISSTS